jgi:ABC-type amino acid transport substrate-binding protein
MDSTTIGIIGAVATLLAAIITPAVQQSLQRRQEKARQIAKASRLSTVEQRGFVNCGLINHYPLCSSHEAEGEVYALGLYAVLAAVIARNTGLRFRCRHLGWDQLPAAFAGENLDLVLSVFETSKRLQFADFVAPFYTIGVGGIALSGNPKLQDPDAPLGPDLKIAVCRGEAGWEMVEHDLKIPPRNVLHVSDPDISAMMDLLLTRRVDVAIADNVTCAGYAAKHPEVRPVFFDPPLCVYKNSIMVPKNEPDWAAWVDRQARLARTSPDFQTAERDVLQQFPKIVRKLG